MSRGINFGMPYRRRVQYPFNSNTPTSVGIYWSQQYNAYACKWMDTHHFKEMTPIMSYFKSKPYGDCVYDPDNKIWYFKEEYLADVKNMLMAFGPTIFEINFVEKPVNASHNGYLSNTRPTQTPDQLMEKFKQLSNQDIKNLEYTEAKKIYRRVCMKMHPDYNPGDENAATRMSSINEVWTELERIFYLTKKEPTYNASE